MEELGFTLPRTTEDGGTVVSQTYGSTPNRSAWKMRTHDAVAGETTFFDIEITTEIKLRSGSYYVDNIADIHTNDYIELSLIDKNDVLGLFFSYGLTVGQDILELHKLVQTEHPIPNGYEFGINAWAPQEVYTGLFLRVAYNSFGSTNIRFRTRLFWFEGDNI